MTFVDAFASPWFLLILPVAVALVLLVSRRSLAGLDPVRRWTSITTRVVIVVLLILALAESRLLWKNDRLAVIFLIDRSASVPPEHQKAALDFVRTASANRDRARGDVVGCVVFGRNAGIEAIPRERDLFQENEDFSIIIERDVTDIESAIRVAMAAFPEGYGKRLVLISDGNENRGNSLEEARAAIEAGITVDVLPVRYEYPGEVLVEKIVVEPEVSVGEPFDVRIVVDSTRETEANILVSESGRHLSTQRVQLQPGKNVFTVPRRIDDASQTSMSYQVLVEPLDQDDDQVVQNNMAHAFTFVRGLPRVLLCTDDPELDAALVQALRDERIAIDVKTPEYLASDVSAYLTYSAIIFSNVGAHHLSSEKMRMFESLVKGAGLGFVMIGGEESFGAGGYLGSPVEDLLPVYMDVKQKKSLPNGALAVIMHSCEINNGNFWAKATVQQAIRVLSPQDYCGVLYYGGMGGETWLFPMLPCTKKGYMLSRLMGFNVGDMPDFARIFQMAHTQLKKTPAALKHIIVFSDGDPTMPSNAQIKAIRDDNITISTICMGWHTSPANMQKLAQDGQGNYYSLTGPDKLPEIFIREAITVRKALIQERDFLPIVNRGGSFLAGIDLGSLPPLHGYVITSKKEAADHYLEAPPVEGDLVNDPVLSSWYYGLGKAVAFTSDSGRRWASDWGSWDGYRQFWGQLVRWVSKKQTDDRFRVTNRKEGDRGVVYVDAIDADGRFVNDLDFDARVVTPGPDFKTVPVEVRQIGAGRYRIEFDVGKEGNYLVSLEYMHGDGEKRLYTTGMVNPYSPEYRSMATNDALLQRVADVTGGRVLGMDESAGDTVRSVFRRDFPISTTPQDTWRSLLHIAAILFFFDVFVRRVIIDWVKAYRAVRDAMMVLFTRRAAPEGPADDRLGSLLKRKAEVSRAQEGYRSFYEASDEKKDAQLDETFVAGTDAPAPSARKPAPSATTEEKAPPTKQETYTSRLLAAKRRALKRDDDERG